MNKMMQNGLLVASLSAAVLAGVFVGRSGPNPHQAQGGLKTTFGNGVWEVGKEIMPGTYTTNGGTSCYWARTRNLNGGIGGIIANGNPSGHVVVTIEPTDKGFTTQGCGTWTREPGSVPVASAHKAVSKHTVSSLPQPEQTLLRFASGACHSSVLSTMEVLVGDGSMEGSGLYPGKLTMKPGKYRSYNIFWTVNVKPHSVLSTAHSGERTFKFWMSHDGDHVRLPSEAMKIWLDRAPCQ